VCSEVVHLISSDPYSTPWAHAVMGRYDSDHDGRLSRTEFERLMDEYIRGKTQAPDPRPPPEPAKAPKDPPRPPEPPRPLGENGNGFKAPLPLTHHTANLTHYNETTGVPLPPDSVRGSLRGVMADGCSLRVG
jgi:hypothetical protein